MKDTLRYRAPDQKWTKPSREWAHQSERIRANVRVFDTAWNECRSWRCMRCFYRKHVAANGLCASGENRHRSAMQFFFYLLFASGNNMLRKNLALIITKYESTKNNVLRYNTITQKCVPYISIKKGIFKIFNLFFFLNLNKNMTIIFLDWRLIIFRWKATRKARLQTHLTKLHSHCIFPRGLCTSGAEFIPFIPCDCIRNCDCHCTLQRMKIPSTRHQRFSVRYALFLRKFPQHLGAP